MSAPPFHHVAIFGPGLLGGSVALAVRERFPETEIRLWGRRTEAVTQTLASGLADFAGTDVSAVASGADLIVMATPVAVMETVLEQAVGAFSPGVVVTDVGSVKRPVIDAVATLVADSGGEFVGAHPMAGSENAGIEHARSDLFEGAACILTPEPRSARPVVERLGDFWRDLGAVIYELDADAHDAAVARISHVPHVAASAVAAMALGEDESLSRLAGGGFRDTTRVAAGDADLWAGILMENREALKLPLEELARSLQDVADSLANGDSESLRAFLDHARKLRHSCPPQTPSSTE